MATLSVKTLDQLIRYLSGAIVGFVAFGIVNFVWSDSALGQSPLANLASSFDTTSRIPPGGDKKQLDVAERKKQSFVEANYTTATGVNVTVSDHSYLNKAIAQRHCDNYGAGIKPEQYQAFQSKLEHYCQPEASAKNVERCKQGLEAIKKLCPTPKAGFNFFGLG